MKKLFNILCLLFIGFQLNGQDIHFSHIHATPIHLNPAMTGVIQGAEMRFIANSRLQWETFTKGYKTISASLDMKLLALNSSSVLSGGLQLYADRAGDLNFSTNAAALNISVQKSFDARSRNMVSIGFKGAYLNHRIDYSKMIGYEIETELLESAPNSLQNWDLGAGMTWFHTSHHKDFFYLGASVFHLNQPTISFFGDLDNWEDLPEKELGKVLYRKIVLHGGGNFRLQKNISALPSFIFQDQGPHREIKIGSFFKYGNSQSQKKNDYAIYLGGWLRWYIEKDIFGTDAFDLSLRVDHNKTIYTFSFDINTSKLTRASYGLGGPELSIIKLIDWNRPRRKKFKVKCPIM